MRTLLFWTKNANFLTKKEGGKPYLRILSAKIRTAQKCIQELKTCMRETCTFSKKFPKSVIREYEKA